MVLSISLGVVVRTTKEPLLEVFNADGILQPEVATVTTRAATQPGEDTKGNANNTTKRQVGVISEREANIKEDFLKRRNGKLGLQCLWGIDDLVEGLEDRCAANKNVVASHGIVPVLSILREILLAISCVSNAKG